MDTLEVRSAMVELEGGQKLRVSRYTEPTTGREVLTIARAWTDDVVGFPAAGKGVLTLPADCTRDLISALQGLEGADHE